MSNQLVITSGAKVRSLNGVITGTTGVLDSLPINAANGIPQLDSSGKILVSQLPNSVMEYKGTWNAATNTPTLADGTGNQGDVYLCNVAGTVNFGSGPIAFVVGDQVIYSGTIWQRASGATGTVTSVAVTESGDALSITGSPITTSGTVNIGFAGSSAQYVAGDGSLVTFPTIINEAQNLITDVYNETGATLTKGTVVYINGGHGNLPTVTKAIATNDATSAQTYGVVQADITNNNNGHVVVIGSLGDLDTQAYAAGTQLYLSSTTAGAWTSVKQYAPAHLVYVGIVVRSHPTQGIVEVRIQNGFELDELHNVSAQSPLNNQGIFYNSSTSLWENKSIATALGYTPISLTSLSATTPLSYNNTTGAFSISQATTSTNGYLSSTDWNTFNSKGSGSVTSVALSAPTGFSVTGSPITSSGTLALAFATGYSLPTNASQTNWDTAYSLRITSATSPLSITSNVISISQASGSTNGYLSSTDWNTFNGKQSALTNPVTGTGTSGQVTYFNGTSSITSSANLAWDGTNLSIGNPSSPLAQLHVYNASAATTILLQTNSTTDYSEIAVRNNASTATSYFRQYSTATTGSDFGISRAGLALFFSNYATNFAIGTRNGGNLILGTNDTERMRILSSNGWFGIGTTSPVGKFEIAGAANNYTTAPAVTFTDTMGNADSNRWIVGNIATDYGSFNIANTPNASSTTFTSRFTITKAGNVGIGTTSPTSPLHVGTATSGNQKIQHWGEPGFVDNYGLILRGSSLDGVFKFYGLNNGTETSAPILSMNRSSGNVGIGTTSPSGKLNISNGGAAGLEFDATGGSSSGGYMQAFNRSTNVFTPLDIYANIIAFQTGTGGSSTERMRITSGGDICIGTTTVNDKLTINGGVRSIGSSAGYFWNDRSNSANFYGWYATSNVVYFFNGSANAASITPSTGVYTPLSDINKKKDFEQSTIGLNAILSLKPTLYRMKTDSKDSNKQLGFIAQEVKEFIPQAFVESEDFIGLNYNAIIAALVKSVQELEARLKTIENK